MSRPDATLDTFGLLCPVPIMKTSSMILDMVSGQVLEVLADDEQILEDMPAWCKSMGHELLQVDEVGDEFRLLVRKGN
ncbi:MAG: sulfurtransferase TusA family protein [Gemmatimonadota bacterium]|nr:sulfurtransferase TusA family protein [Gemmatimonadota bacterium]